MASRQKITRDYISSLLQKYNTEIVEWPEKLGSKVSIKFKCSRCKENTDKQIRYVQKNGAYCKTCLLEDTSIRTKHDNSETIKLKTYNREYVFLLLKKNNATLAEDIDDEIDRDTKIHYRCCCAKINNYNEKTIRNIEITGAFCKDCIKNKSNEKRTETNLEKYGVKHTYELWNLEN